LLLNPNNDSVNKQGIPLLRNIKSSQVPLYYTPMIPKQHIKNIRQSSPGNYPGLLLFAGRELNNEFSKESPNEKIYETRFQRHLSRLLELKIKIQGNSINATKILREVIFLS